ncbi:hypothetical protein OPV22_010147 [Ensete ventricosum]|uniref:Uncharacterized protein n=1 Tax=Ensete ventricosum TaxID=4639 RepID=A0AAV8Q1P9_ENSVE|nr:hypothetical protein OPV22_010147 [Ensete ventricosum]RWW53997.1 hypothetical protein BHE74_00039457 [Ensete ventricosum]
MSSHARPAEPLGVSRKRKDRESPPDLPRAHPASKAEPGKEPTSARWPTSKEGNLLLAGYLANEFLTKGTLFGKKLGPGRADPGKRPLEPDSAEPAGTYAEVSYLLMRGGAQIPGVVNPTELARWLQM